MYGTIYDDLAGKKIHPKVWRIISLLTSWFLVVIEEFNWVYDGFRQNINIIALKDAQSEYQGVRKVLEWIFENILLKLNELQFGTGKVSLKERK